MTETSGKQTEPYFHNYFTEAGLTDGLTSQHLTPTSHICILSDEGINHNSNSQNGIDSVNDISLIWEMINKSHHLFPRALLWCGLTSDINIVNSLPYL